MIPTMKQLRASRRANVRALKRTNAKLDLLREIEQLKEAQFNAKLDLVEQCAKRKHKRTYNS